MAIDYYKLRKKLIPEPDGEPPVVMRTGTIDAVNVDGTVDVEMSSGVILPDIPRLANMTAPVGTVVNIISFRGSLLVIGPSADNSVLGNLLAVKTGTVNAGPVAATSFTQAVAYGITFPAIPSAHVGLSGSGAAPTATWIYSALNQSTTGFTLLGFAPSGIASTFTTAFRWSAILAP